MAAAAPGVCRVHGRAFDLVADTRALAAPSSPTARTWSEHGAYAAFLAPLEATVTGRRLGVLGVAWDHEPEFDADDLAVVTAFAQQAGQALERILLHDSERVVRDRFQLLAALGARLDEEIELRDRIEAFLDVVVPGFAVSTRVQLVDESDPTHRRSSCTRPATAESEIRPVDDPADDGAGARRAATRRARGRRSVRSPSAAPDSHPVTTCSRSS